MLLGCKFTCVIFLSLSSYTVAGQQAVHRHMLGADLDGATRSPLFDRLANAWNMGSVFKTRLQLWANQESILEGFLWWREQQLQESHSVPDANSPSYRIVGGRAVENAARFGYVASLRDWAGNHVCGGTLITNQAVLTAAHCLDQVQIHGVQLGRHASQSSNPDEQAWPNRKCSETQVHPDWSEETRHGDIGLCILDEQVLDVQPVRIPQGVLSIPTNSVQLTVIGLGATSEGGSKAEELQSVNVYKQGLESCRGPYENIEESQICAGLPEGGKDACQGDSGGPLLLLPGPASSNTEDVQVGVVSYGRGCARAGFPGVYTNVASYRDWIEQQLEASPLSSAMPKTVYNIAFNVSKAQPISSPDPPGSPPAALFGGLGLLGGLGNIFQNLGSVRRDQ